jgi:hypothetical protein
MPALTGELVVGAARIMGRTSPGALGGTTATVAGMIVELLASRYRNDVHRDVEGPLPVKSG